jgi:hypothetical protein
VGSFGGHKGSVVIRLGREGLGPARLRGCGQPQRAPLGVLADGPPLGGMHHASAQRLHPGQYRREILNGKVGHREGVSRTACARVDPHGRNGRPGLPALRFPARAARAARRAGRPRSEARARAPRRGTRSRRASTAPSGQRYGSRRASTTRTQAAFGRDATRRLDHSAAPSFDYPSSRSTRSRYWISSAWPGTRPAPAPRPRGRPSLRARPRDAFSRGPDGYA